MKRTFKTILAATFLIAALAMLAYAVPAAVESTDTAYEQTPQALSEAATLNAEAEITQSGTCGENLTWTLDSEGTLTISGTGEMTNWGSYKDVPWYSSSNSVKSVVIENGVTSISNEAFYYCYSLTRIELPDSVTSIGDYAFSNCDSLASIKIPDSVTSIGDYAFYWCTSLTSITIPDSVTSIGDGAFYDCDSLTSIEIPDSVTSIGGDYAFYGCSNLTIYGYADSYAQTYAEENDIPFVIIGKEPDELLGDINHDESIDVNDAILVLQHSMFPDLYPVAYEGSLDFNKDGYVDVNDAILLLQYSMFPDLYPIA